MASMMNVIGNTAMRQFGDTAYSVLILLALVQLLMDEFSAFTVVYLPMYEQSTRSGQ
jgi:hypothetical protein